MVCWVALEVAGWHTSGITWGFTASTQVLVSVAASVAVVTALMLKSAISASRSAAIGSMTHIDVLGAPWRIMPAIRLRAILPPPMNAIGDGLGSRVTCGIAMLEKEAIMVAVALVHRRCCTGRQPCVLIGDAMGGVNEEGVCRLSKWPV